MKNLSKIFVLKIDFSINRTIVKESHEKICKRFLWFILEILCCESYCPRAARANVGCEGIVSPRAQGMRSGPSVLAGTGYTSQSTDRAIPLLI